MSIRSRLILLSLVVSLLPAIPLSLLVKTLLEKSFTLGLSAPIGEALQNGIAVSRDHLDMMHAAFESDVASLVAFTEEAVPDSAAIAGQLAMTPKPFRHIDGFFRAPPSPAGGPALWDRERVPELNALTGGAAIDPRDRAEGEIEAVRFYTTSDRAVQLAVWHTTHDDIILFNRIDPVFLQRSGRLLSGLQLFAQLRLSQPWLSRSFFYPFIIIYSVILLLALVLALLMSERLANPLRRLSRGVGEVARGNWSYRVEARVGGETGQLIETFNWMVSQLDQQHRRLTDLEKMATWREMARYLAHEVKNPLLPIRLTVQEIQDQYRGDDGAYKQLVAESVRVVEDELANLQALVKEFSSFARMPELTPCRSSFEELAADVLKLYPQVPASIKCDPGTETFVFDRDQMRRVLINLMENAVAALAECRGDPRITIALTQQNGEIVVTFADNGPGIPPENEELVFEPYYSNRSGGSGIGLAMVKNIVVLHGGAIRVEAADGGGAKFVLTFPADGARQAPPAGGERRKHGQE